jgi:hypothetical protein
MRFAGKRQMGYFAVASLEQFDVDSVRRLFYYLGVSIFYQG